MGWFDDALALAQGIIGWEEATIPIGGIGAWAGLVDNFDKHPPASSNPSAPYDPVAVARARKQLAALAAGTAVIVGAPTLYIALKGRKRGKRARITEKDVMLGKSLENASTQATALAMTGLASPAIAAVAAYLLIQKLEDSAFITKGLGNAAQTLLTVAAAGPAIQGIGQIAGSAFKAAK